MAGKRGEKGEGKGWRMGGGAVDLIAYFTKTRKYKKPCILFPRATRGHKVEEAKFPTISSLSQ